MKKRSTTALVVLVLVVGLGLVLFLSTREDAYDRGARYTGNMRITSPAFQYEGVIPFEYTCDGDNVSPPLAISDVPEGTESLVLIADDPDVPKNLKPDGLWVHWLLWNVPPDTKEIPEGATPPGEEGKNTSGTTGYQGPCPPDREHRYFFKLYALDTMLELDAELATKKDIERAIEGHILAQAELMGRYERQQ